MTAYPRTHLLNPAFKYANAHTTQQPGYLAMKFARIVAAREVSDADSHPIELTALPIKGELVWMGLDHEEHPNV